MPQDFTTFDRLTARENIELIADLHSVQGIKEVMRKVGVYNFKDKRFGDLSGGMKTRVGVGMALVSDSELLFLDEPTSGLDPRARREIWGLVKELKEMGKTIFLTNHYMEEVEELSDRAAIIINGEIKRVETIEELVKEFGGGIKVTVRNEGIARELVKKNAFEIIEENPTELVGVFRDKQRARQTLISLFQNDCEVGFEEGGMDEVFLRLVGSKISEEGELV